MRKRTLSILGNLPSENGAEATMGMLYEWPELNRFVSLETLVALYNFETDTLEMVLRSLLWRGLLETRKRHVGGKKFCARVVTFYRRIHHR